ncbi:MAG TPA: hypothetical protein PKC43_00675 [Phycisphaerales bacterium]|nr:hypothetical protein [Phycisphaerales bacterium]HMP35939.1 hypothetical protein [Phycisphaerales bacterium]
MGQLTLGLRSLAIKALIFFVLAAVLAWILGGTLFPRPERVEGEPVLFGDRSWFVRLSVGGDAPGEARYELMMRDGERRPEPQGESFIDASEIVLAADRIVVGMRLPGAQGGGWVLREVAADGAERRSPLPSRLAVEEALEAFRVGAGSEATRPSPKS